MATAGYNKIIKVATDGSSFSEIKGLRDASISFGGDVLDTTTFENSTSADAGVRSKMYGLRDASVSLSGDFLPESDAHQIEFFHEWLRNYVYDGYTNLKIQYYPTGSSACFQFQVKLESLEISGDVSGKEEISISLQSTGTITYTP